MLADLHASEINGGISWVYDSSWRVVLGDRINGYDDGANVGSIEEAAEWLVSNAVWRHPESVFAEKYRHLVPDADRLAEEDFDDQQEDDDLGALDGAEPGKYIEILLRQGPGPESDFIEALDSDGQPITDGEWLRRSDGTWAFRIPTGIEEFEEEARGFV